MRWPGAAQAEAAVEELRAFAGPELVARVATLLAGVRESSSALRLMTGLRVLTGPCVVPE
jgi:hypothetical protein